MAFRLLKLLSRRAGDALVRVDRAGRIAPLKRASPLEESHHCFSTSLFRNGQSPSFHGVRYGWIPVRAAASDALDIVRYLDGAEDENNGVSGDFERFRASGEDFGADVEVENGSDRDSGAGAVEDPVEEVGKFGVSDGDSGADNDEVVESVEEFGRFSDSDEDYGRFRFSDGDSGADEVVEIDDEFERLSDSDGDSGDEFGRFWVSDGDSGADDEVEDHLKDFGRFRVSDEDSSAGEMEERVEEGETFSDLDGDSGDEFSRLKPHADGMYRKVIDSIANPEALAVAFENIKKKYGKIIFRSQENIDWRWCEQTADALRAGTYAFRPVRHVNVPVLGHNSKMRSIRVVSPKDQIILECFRAALEKIYAPFSSPHVHTCKHTALEQVKYGWRGTSWFMEFGVEHNYDDTNHKRLKNILSEKIQDKRFLDTLFQMFNAGVIGLEKTNIEEGGILSSVLCNIYYQKLDEEIEAIKKEWNSGAKSRTMDPAYKRLMVFDKKTLARIGNNAEQMRREKQHRLAMARKLAISRHNLKDPNFTRVQYVRFGENFLLGLSGSKSTGARIMKRLTTFLQSNLQLEVDPETTRLSHAVSDKTLFLGAYIRVLDPKELPEVSSSLTRALARKRAQTMRVKQQLEDRWTRECRNVVLKCWTGAFEKWRRELGKDGAKRKTFEAATQQLLSIPEEDSHLWREKAQNVLHVFISAALRQGLFPQDEVESYYKVLASLEKSLAKVPQHELEDSDV